jgi:hypothetical protein
MKSIIMENHRNITEQQIRNRYLNWILNLSIILKNILNEEKSNS